MSKTVYFTSEKLKQEGDSYVVRVKKRRPPGKVTIWRDEGNGYHRQVDAEVSYSPSDKQVIVKFGVPISGKVEVYG